MLTINCLLFMFKMNLFLRERGIISMVSLFLAFNGRLFLDTSRDTWHS